MTAACAPRRTPPPRHVATIAHTAPGEARVTCTCAALRTSVDVDDRAATRFVLWEHLDRHVNDDHLLVDDTRTGLLYTVTDANGPETRLVLTAAGVR